MKLIIAEKPSLGKDIALAIPGTCQFADGFITVGDYTVTWAVGHLVELTDPTEGERWTLESLPLFSSPWQVQPVKRTIKQFNLIKQLLTQCDSVIHAGDPDDEGQLIVDEILELCDNRKPVYRLSTNDNNHAVIRKALNHLKPNSEFIAQGRAAYARSVADFLFGLNLTRFYTLASGGELLSIGRVQTPTLGLIVQRDHAIDNHIVKHYYQLAITVTGKTGAKIQLLYQIKDGDPVDDSGHITDPQFFQTLMANLSQRSGTLSITHVIEKQSPPLPFNLTKLQTLANKTLGFATAKTLKLTQSLRDKHKAITYNRTDCQYLNDEHFADAPALLEQIQANLNQSFSTINSDKKPRCFNSANVTAHHAIIPTLKAVNMSDLTDDEAKIYELIATYYVIQFMPPAQVQKSTTAIVLDGHCFRATAAYVLVPSWQLFTQSQSAEKRALISQIPAGDYPTDLSEYDLLKKATQPPPRYTEASLTTDMTSVAKYCQNPKVKAILLEKDDGKKGENGSIGTVATRACIIEKLISRGFVKRQKKQLVSTELGRRFYYFLPDSVKSIDITAYWWLIQEDIKVGKQTADDLIVSVYRTVKSIIDQGADSVPTFVADTEKSKKSKQTRKKYAK